MRFLTDWKLWFSIAFVGLVALAAFSFFNAIEDRKKSMAIAEETLVAQAEERRVAAARAEELAARIDGLTEELQKANESVNRLEDQVSQLREQVINLGGEPVVVEETVIVRGDGSQPSDSSSDDGSDGSFTTQEAEPVDPCGKRNPQGKCVDNQGKKKGKGK